MKLRALVGAALTTLALVGCGGGGGEAGGPDTMELSVTDWTLEYDPGNLRCEPAAVVWTDVLIFGGKGNLRVENLQQNLLQLDTSQIANRRFRVAHRGGCTLTEGIANAILVLDSSGQRAGIKIVFRVKEDAVIQ